ncbi:ATP-dependent RNA helicase HrpA [Candidatus Halobeggiatoa sp. HSG11]|nr:ATP-dependent RNA helicase HrpA [Candidatus Halobeggiatoa sp. HSG11]
MNLTELHGLSNICKDIMRCDQHRFQKRIHSLTAQLKADKNITTEFTQLAANIKKSLQQRQLRITNLPAPNFPDDLPVSQQREEIATAIKNNQVIVIAGETGSGKTTQIPKICLSLGLGTAGLIGCTQPRRIAARTVASRVASELASPLGHAIGYKVRFSDRLSANTYVKFMTDGILLAETQTDRFLNNYDTIIIDEAHERNLNVDFLLGYLKQLLPNRPDLKLIITSATIDTQRFATHFNNAPIIEVSGRTYPVETRYRPLLTEEDDNRDVIQGILDAVDEIDQRADILIFLAGERDIRETAEALRKHKLQHTEILPLYARLSAAEQNRIFNPGSLRRIVLATNVAETSLTVPRIKAVIDPGLARISRYSIRNKVQRLPIEAISRSSADQRKGRCGRIAAGICIRLYSAEDYDLRPEFTDPEILRTSLAAVILQMLALRLGDVYKFPFVEPPTAKMINDGFTLLAELGAVNANRKLTKIGQQLAKMPIDPRIGSMILAAKQEACLHEILIIASALTIQDPRERPMDAQQAADTAQQQFVNKTSDFLSYLKLWDFWQENAKHLSQNKLRKLCRKHFLSYMRMREWRDIHQQLYIFVRESGWQVNSKLDLTDDNKFTLQYATIHRALLKGLLGNVAFKTETDKKPETYLGARNIKFHIFPGSGLFKKQPKWTVAAELVETSRLYARCCAKIEPEWIEHVAGDLCQHHYFEPHWQKKQAQVGAFEKVTLYGLTIVAKRRVNYGPLDPELAREIFIRNALVQGEYYCYAKFFQHNQALVIEIEALEHKSRRQDILADEKQIYDFYAAKIPMGIYTGKAFEKWRKSAEKKQAKLLFLSKEDLMQHEGEQITPQAFPDNIALAGVNLPLNYHFEPGHQKDGVTIDIPLNLLNQLEAQIFEWLVPGLLEEKITALLRGMPKAVRKAFVPVPSVAKDAVDTLVKPMVTFRQGGSFLEYPTQSLLEALTIFCHRRLGKPLPDKVWNLTMLPPHLLMNFRLIDDHKELAVERDLTILQQQWGNHASTTSQQQIADKTGLEQDNITTWDFPDLSSQVTIEFKGMTIQGFPTLIDQDSHVNLRVLDKQDLAQHLLGLRRLFWLNLPTKKLLKQMPIDGKLCLKYMKIGNCERLKQGMLTALIDAIFVSEPLPMKKSDFEYRLYKGKPDLLPAAYNYATQLAKTLEEYNTLNQQLQKFSNSIKAIPTIKQHLQHLIYEDFLQEISLSQLQHFPRYLKAIQLRLTRLELDPNKDARKAEQISSLWQAYWQRATTDMSLEVKEFRWLLEELRVSLFAPELKTVRPVSVQRLEREWKKVK